MQHLGLASVLLLAAGLVFTVTKWRGGLHLTFSQHVAHNRNATIFYSLLFIVTLPLLYAFFASWLVPTKGISEAFLWLAAVAVIFQIACTWVPEEGGKKTIIHRILTGISGIALVPMTAIIATTQDLPAGHRYAAGVALILMGILLVIAFINQKGLKYALLLQVIYYALFFGVILFITYA